MHPKYCAKAIMCVLRFDILDRLTNKLFNLDPILSYLTVLFVIIFIVHLTFLHFFIFILYTKEYIQIQTLNRIMQAPLQEFQRVHVLVLWHSCLTRIRHLCQFWYKFKNLYQNWYRFSRFARTDQMHFRFC